MSEGTIISIARFLFRRNGITRLEFEDHKRAVMYKDTCEATHKGLEGTLNAKFQGIERFMTEKFENLEELVKNNGQVPPRIQT